MPDTFLIRAKIVNAKNLARSWSWIASVAGNDDKWWHIQLKKSPAIQLRNLEISMALFLICTSSIKWLYRHFWYQQPGSLPYKMLESQVVTLDCPLIFRAKVRKARYNAWPQETTVWGQKRSWESTKKNSSVPLKPSLLVAHAVRGR